MFSKHKQFNKIKRKTRMGESIRNKRRKFQAKEDSVSIKICSRNTLGANTE